MLDQMIFWGPFQHGLLDDPVIVGTTLFQLTQSTSLLSPYQAPSRSNPEHPQSDTSQSVQDNQTTQPGLTMNMKTVNISQG